MAVSADPACLCQDWRASTYLVTTYGPTVPRPAQKRTVFSTRGQPARNPRKACTFMNMLECDRFGFSIRHDAPPHPLADAPRRLLAHPGSGLGAAVPACDSRPRSLGRAADRARAPGGGPRLAHPGAGGRPPRRRGRARRTRVTLTGADW